MRLKNKVMLVTGGGSGIGQATVLLCAREGAKVAVVYRSEAGRIETERMLQEQGGEGLFIQADVRYETDWQRVISAVEEKYGRLNVLFSNAGIHVRKPVTEVTVDEWDDLLDVNLKGAFLGVKHTIPLMIKSGGGSIIIITSTFGLVGGLTRPAYCASRGAVIALTRQLALDYVGQNIRVNCLCSGPVLVPRVRQLIEEGNVSAEEMLKEVPMGRFAQPQEIAASVVFLASDEASYITGSTLVVDGGWTAH